MSLGMDFYHNLVVSTENTVQLAGGALTVYTGWGTFPIERASSWFFEKSARIRAVSGLPLIRQQAVANH
jgi:hypothetical protein